MVGHGGVFVLRTYMRRAIRVVWIIGILIILAVIPWMAESMSREGYTTRDIAIAVAGCFTLPACLLTIWQIAMHLDNFTNPQQQLHVVRILLMVPIYALNAWIALVWFDSALYLDTLRKVYEARVPPEQKSSTLPEPRVPPAKRHATERLVRRRLWYTSSLRI